MLESLKHLHVCRIRRNHLGAPIRIKQVGTFEVPQIALTVVAIANQTAWRVVREGFEPCPELAALTLNFHDENPFPAGGNEGATRE